VLVQLGHTAVASTRPRGGFPLAWHITALCAAVAIPLLLLSGFLLYGAAQTERSRLEDEARGSARDIAVLLERELAGKAAMLQGLATSTSLQNRDLQAFDRHLRALPRDEDSAYVLRDLSGQQLINTRLPWGAPLPRVGSGARDADRRAIETKQPQVSGLFIGSASRMPIFVVEVPVVAADGSVAFLLAAGVPIARLQSLIRTKKLPDGGWVTVTDRDGTIIARSIATHTIGQPVVPRALEAIQAAPVNSTYLTSPEGVRNFAAFHRVDLSEWTAAVAVPEETLFSPLKQFMRRMVILSAVALLFSLIAAVAVGGRIARAVTALAAAADALGRGQPVPPVASTVREVKAVGAALATAEGELTRRAAERDDLLRTLGRSPAIVRDLRGRILFWGAGAEALYGWSADEAIGRITHELLATEFPMPLEQIEAELRQNGSWDGELRHRAKDGRSVTVASHWAVRRDHLTGEPLTVVQTNTDITQKLTDQERLKMLAREVDHRAKNMLAVIQSLVRLSRADSVRNYATLIQGRVAALARAHTLLSESRWQGVRLERLVAEQMAPFRKRGNDRVIVLGPDIALAPYAAQPVAMVLHELSENAMKHGALSVPEGGVAIEWLAEPGREVVITWTEFRGPAVRLTPERGFGLTVIDRTVRDQLDGDVGFSWRPDGVVCRIALPPHQLAGREPAAA
jgi:PAS domain S-box-containing protein